MEKNAAVLRADIDKSTKKGTGYLTEANLQKALREFDLALKQAHQLGDGFTIRACAFNVGAVYIALHQPEKGLELLQRAIPPPEEKDGKSNGDLFYNFGLAYEALDRASEAVRYYELALEEYQSEKDNVSMETDVAMKAGDLYSELGEWLPAARAYGVAANVCARVEDRTKEAVSLCHQATSLLRGGRQENAIRSADDCMVLCQTVTEDQTLGE